MAQLRELTRGRITLLTSNGGSPLSATAAQIEKAQAPAGEISARLRQLIADGGGDVAVVTASYVGHLSPLADTLDDPRFASALLVGDTGPIGVMRVGAAEIAAVSEALDSAPHAGGPSSDGKPNASDIFAVMHSALSARQARHTPLGPYLAAEITDEAEFERITAQLAATNEHRIRLRDSARAADGFYSTFVIRKISRATTAAFLRLGVPPNPITIFSLFIGLVAAAAFAWGTPWALVAGAIALQISLVIDCSDGEVARYTRRFSPFGAWLDGVSDRLKEFAIYAGLAWGAMRVGGEDLWLLACAALAILVVRHLVDFGFAAQSGGETGETTGASAARDPALGDRVAALSTATDRRAAVMWAKRVVILPIGERWLLISVAAALFGARTAFITLLAASMVAASYTTAGRVLRSIGRPPGQHPRQATDLAVMVDDAPLVSAHRPPRWLTARFSWLAPALWRVAEYVALVAIATLGGVPAAVTFGLLTVLAIHQYDLVYRLRGPAVAMPVSSVLPGATVRCLLVALAVVVAKLTGALS